MNPNDADRSDSAVHECLGANTVECWFEPDLEYNEAMLLIHSMRKAFPELRNYESREEGKAHFLNNGPMVEPEEEFFTSVEASKAMVAWGRDVTLNHGISLATTFIAAVQTHLELLRLKSFDHTLRYALPYQSNHYAVLAQVMYSPDTVGRLNAGITAGDANGAALLDNDLHMLYRVGVNRTGFLRVTGFTTSSEVESDKFEERDIKVSFGIRLDRVPLLDRPASDELANHVSLVRDLCAKYVVPFIVEPLVAATHMEAPQAQDVSGANE